MSQDVRERLLSAGWRGVLDILMRPGEGAKSATLETASAQTYAGVHDYEGTTWFDRDRFHNLLFWKWLDDAVKGQKKISKEMLKKLIKAADGNGYRLEDFQKDVIAGEKKKSAPRKSASGGPKQSR
jgi:hypothetical protein